MKKLRVWLRSRGGDLGEDEILRIWKGLFYCFWMSDKPLVQGLDQNTDHKPYDYEPLCG